MKTKILLTTFTIAVAASMASSTARASMMCQHDWLNAWREASNAQIQAATSWPSCCVFTRSTRVTNWAVSSMHGNAGRQSVIGLALCSSTPGGTATTGNRACAVPGSGNSVCRDEPASQYGSNCWCRIISPAVGRAWVFIGDEISTPDCTANCAFNCAYNVRSTQPIRAAVLAP